jgi:hypothetical protein
MGLYRGLHLCVYTQTHTHTHTHTQGDSIRTENIQQFISQYLVPPGDRNAYKFQDPMSGEGGRGKITVAIQFCAY